MSSLYIIIIHALPLFICIFLLHFLSTHKTQYESSPYLHFASYNNTHSDMVYDIYSILSKNEFLNDTLDQLRQTLFFKIFKINLEPDCTIFHEQQFCNSANQAHVIYSPVTTWKCLIYGSNRNQKTIQLMLT